MRSATQFIPLEARPHRPQHGNGPMVGTASFRDGSVQEIHGRTAGEISDGAEELGAYLLRLQGGILFRFPDGEWAWIS